MKDSLTEDIWHVGNLDKD